MPRHDYRCDRCNHTVELSFSTADMQEDYLGSMKCPKCPHGLLQRQPAAPSFTIKGFNAQNGYSK